MVGDEVEDVETVANQKRKALVLAHSQYVIKYTAKTKFARLHLRNGCWRSHDARDCVPVLELEEAEYDEICHLCWPKGSRPLDPETGKEKNTKTAIRTVAGIRTEVEGREDDSSTTESSSSSMEPSDTETGAKDKGLPIATV